MRLRHLVLFRVRKVWKMSNMKCLYITGLPQFNNFLEFIERSLVTECKSTTNVHYMVNNSNSWIHNSEGNQFTLSFLYFIRALSYITRMSAPKGMKRPFIMSIVFLLPIITCFALSKGTSARQAREAEPMAQGTWLESCSSRQEKYSPKKTPA